MRKWILTAFCILAFCSSSFASILWMGGEDVDFPNLLPIVNGGGGGTYRTGYARTSISGPVGVSGFLETAFSASTVFPGGAVTSCWLSAQLISRDPAASFPIIGLGTEGTYKSVYLGLDSTFSNKLALWKTDGTTSTELASEAGANFTSTLTKVDIQLISYGATATVNVYLDGSGTADFSFTGDVTAGGATSVNSVFLYFAGWASEIFASTTDTRAQSLVTLVPTGAGVVNTWDSGTFANINPVVINDASIINSATAAENFAATLNPLPTGTFSVQALKVIARSIKGSSGITSISPGVYTNSTASVPSATALNLYWFPVETYYNINPVTSANWLPAEINLLQIYLQSAL